MFKIQRNFFIENILKETKIPSLRDIKNLPYKDNISLVNKSDDLAIIFFDIDRLKNTQVFLKDLKSLKKSNNISIFIFTSSNKKKLKNFEKRINKQKNDSFIFVNIFNLGVS